MSQFALPDRDEPYGNSPRSTRLRRTALDQAIVYLQNRNGLPGEAVEVAEEFLKFLEGGNA